MASVIYCGILDVPLEYCRYYPKYDKSLEWMKENHPDVFQNEIKDIQERDPKTAKKIQHLLTDQQEEKDNDSDNNDNDQSNQQKKPQQKEKGKKKRRRRGKKKKENNQQNDDEYDDNKQTKQVQIMEDQVNEQQDIAQQNLDDIQGMLDKLSTSPSKGILKNPTNPNYEQEQQNLNESQLNSDDDSDDLAGPNFLGAAGNRNKARGPPARKDTKKKRRKKKHNRDRRRPKDEEEADENKENEEEEEETMEQRQKRVKFEKMKNKKVPKNIVEVTLENRKGNKKVTIVRGFIEKSKDKEQRIKSEFMKKFATSCMITFQNQGADKGPKQVVLMGDKRYDFMKYLKDKFPKAGKLLYYKTKKYGLTPAVDPDHGFVMPPP